MIYCFDLDNTICQTKDKNYVNSTPIVEVINRINHLHDNGNEIIIYTARGMGRFNGDVKSAYDFYYEMTKSQLDSWGVKYHKLMLGKPSFDYFIDDKNWSIKDFKSKIQPKIGFIAGSFDVIHPGYIHMFENIKKKCDYLIVALQKNPNYESKKKLNLVLSLEERKSILLSLRFVDQIIEYESEDELYSILKTTKIDVRFLGEDYRDKNFTGSDLLLDIHYIGREHGWSTTKFKKLIRDSFC